MAEAGSLLTLDEDQALAPGLIDLHVHAPQFPQLGTCLYLPCEDWLMKYTSPLESMYSDAAFAQHVYDLLSREFVAKGRRPHGRRQPAGERGALGVSPFRGTGRRPSQVARRGR
jgi:hypothetical protein